MGTEENSLIDAYTALPNLQRKKGARRRKAMINQARAMASL